MHSSSSPDVRELLARRGIDLSAPVPEDPPFDPIAWRLEHYAAKLAADIPAMFQDAQPDHAEVRAWLTKHLADPAAFPSLFLSGNTGTGKTHQSFGVLRYLAGVAARANRDFRWLTVTHPDLNAAARIKPDGSHAYAVEPYMEVEFLIVDDLAAGKASEFTNEHITRLIDHRWSRRMATLYTTNLDPDTLEAAIGERALSRLADATRVEMGGADRRFNR
ncbi:ATP-binding protein [Micromonospora sp. NPDC050695]|uniref:ATP-binding protein n=1 Tax=Micromonospora sp. NPDC050695 TaxID=3154938 RepID=UPI0033FB5ECF